MEINTDVLPHLTPEVLEKVNKYMVEETADWKSGVASGKVFRFDTGELVHLYYHTNCHSWVPGVSYERKGYRVVVGTCISLERAVSSQEAVLQFSKWLATESPLSHLIENKDEESLRTHLLIRNREDENTSREQVLWICKAMRYHIESKTSLDLWKYLVDKGVQPLIALWATSFCGQYNVGTGLVTAGMVNTHPNVFHKGYDDPSDHDLVDLLQGNLNPEPSGVSSVFRADRDRTKEPSYERQRLGVKTFNHLVVTTEKSDGWGGKITHQGIPIDDLVKEVLMHQTKAQKEIDKYEAKQQKGTTTNVKENLNASTTSTSRSKGGAGTQGVHRRRRVPIRQDVL